MSDRTRADWFWEIAYWTSSTLIVLVVFVAPVVMALKE